MFSKLNQLVCCCQNKMQECAAAVKRLRINGQRLLVSQSLTHFLSFTCIFQKILSVHIGIPQPTNPFRIISVLRLYSVYYSNYIKWTNQFQAIIML